MTGSRARTWWTQTPPGREPREPGSVVVRGLLAGAVGGALLGAGVQGSDAVYRDWTSVAFAAGVGALVALPAALAAVLVHLAVARRGVRLAWFAAGLAAAVAILAVAAVLRVLLAPPSAVAAAVAFAVALASAKVITTRWGPRRPSEAPGARTA